MRKATRDALALLCLAFVGAASKTGTVFETYGAVEVFDAEGKPAQTAGGERP